MYSCVSGTVKSNDVHDGGLGTSAAIMAKDLDVDAGKALGAAIRLMWLASLYRLDMSSISKPQMEA